MDLRRDQAFSAIAVGIKIGSMLWVSLPALAGERRNRLFAEHDAALVERSIDDCENL